MHVYTGPALQGTISSSVAPITMHRSVWGGLPIQGQEGMAPLELVQQPLCLLLVASKE